MTVLVTCAAPTHNTSLVLQACFVLLTHHQPRCIPASDRGPHPNHIRHCNPFPAPLQINPLLWALRQSEVLVFAPRILYAAHITPVSPRSDSPANTYKVLSRSSYSRKERISSARYSRVALGCKSVAFLSHELTASIPSAP